YALSGDRDGDRFREKVGGEETPGQLAAAAGSGFSLTWNDRRRLHSTIWSPDWSRVGPPIFLPLSRVPFFEATSCSAQRRSRWTGIAQCRRETHSSRITTSLSGSRPTLLRPRWSG